MKYYIAYGSNLNVEQMQRRCPDAVPVGTAMLQGWRLAFRGSKTGSYLTIIPDGEHEVPVAIWKISARDERALDMYEGFPTFYHKNAIRLRMKLLQPTERFSCRTVTAMVYTMRPDAKPGVPTVSYVRTCLEGYTSFGLDTKYLADAVAETEYIPRCAG